MSISDMPSGHMESEGVGNEMPMPPMEKSIPASKASGSQESGGMPAGTMVEPAQRTGSKGTGERVLVELKVPRGEGGLAFARANSVPGLAADADFEPVPVRREGGGARLASAEDTVVIRATIDPDRRAEIEADPNVVKVWKDTQIAPFGKADEIPAKLTPFRLDRPVVGQAYDLELMQGMAACPIGTCDCTSELPKGTIGDVATYLGVDQIWAAGHRGNGVVVGVVDGGIRAEGRSSSESGPKIGGVIGGWPTANWGTTAAAWGDHGNMCGTDVLGMAPEAKLYDLRISDGDAISDALQAFQWAINQHAANGTPHLLTNSWGIFQENWDEEYADNADHPFTRKVIEAIDKGILVFFAAGNCGATCPSGRCGGDTGPGRSIWGANGHPRVITVGAVNKNEQFVGYSSQGPAALDPNKPDFCSITHFTGYFTSDSGTSAATPIAAGVVALLKQAKPALTQDEVKAALKSTAKDIGPGGFDQHSGAGIIRPKAAYDTLATAAQWSGWESLGGVCTDGVGVSSWSANRLDCFVVGTDRHLYHKWYSGGWSSWEDLGGNLYSNPAAVSWGPDRIDVFALGADRAMWHLWWDGSSWSGWESLGGVCTDGVGVSSWSANRLDCFVVGTDRHLYHKWYGGAWSSWEDLGGNLYSNPAAVSWGPDRIDVFALGADRAMWHKWYG